jgi:hypothetical protein
VGPKFFKLEFGPVVFQKWNSLAFNFSYIFICLFLLCFCCFGVLRSQRSATLRKTGARMKSTKHFAIFLILLAALGSTQLVFAQGTDLGTISGTVTDGTGAVVANAKVVIRDLATNAERECLV